jgi:hypothetical protein
LKRKSPLTYLQPTPAISFCTTAGTADKQAGMPFNFSMHFNLGAVDVYVTAQLSLWLLIVTPESSQDTEPVSRLECQDGRLVYFHSQIYAVCCSRLIHVCFLSGRNTTVKLSEKFVFQHLQQHLQRLQIHAWH